MKFEEMILNEERKVKLTVCLHPSVVETIGSSKRPAVLVLPGGGYLYCSDGEAENVAKHYYDAGYQAFVLRYSVGKHATWPHPLEDYEQAMELIRGNAEKWLIHPDKIAVIGFSAGGHLAACAATMARQRPNAAILGYAALQKETLDICPPDLPSPIDHVDEHTCPCFLFSARDDVLVPIENTLKFQMALTEHDIMYESHIYAYGGHGFSTGEEAEHLCRRAPDWIQDSIGWLEDVFGTMQEDGFSEPVCPPKMNADREEMLSADCSIGHLRKQPGEVQTLLTEIFAAADEFEANRGGIGIDVGPMMKRVKLREFLRFKGKSEDEIAQLDTQLRKIPNVR